jgi:hypothetical protein
VHSDTEAFEKVERFLVILTKKYSRKFLRKKAFSGLSNKVSFAFAPFDR